MKFHPWMAWEIKRDQYSRLEFETPYKAYECLFLWMYRYITFVHLARSGGIEMNGMSAKVNTNRISVEILRSLFDDRVSLIPVMLSLIHI